MEFDFTNKDQLVMAMPLTNLTSEQWEKLIIQADKIKGSEGENSLIYKTIQQLMTNQSRLEVIASYIDYHGDKLLEPVTEKKYELFPLI